MSVSKLESLPNELLLDIFEKYINGVDTLIAFTYLQNQRFDSIISQCRRFYFNFFNCRKDDFRLCISLLPDYIDKIEELILSEQNTPGQIHLFLSFFPSFIAFKQLKKLYFDFNIQAIDSLAIQDALLSLSNTCVDTVLIKAMNTDTVLTLDNIVAEMFRLKTIKRLSFISDIRRNRWDFFRDILSSIYLTNISSNVQYLTSFGMLCGFEDLQSIFYCAPHLKYLNVRINTNSFYGYHVHSLNPVNDKLISMISLHTFILSFAQHDPTTFDILARYLRIMPVLRRLEIKAHHRLLDANSWETLLQTSLLSLTYFCLKTTASSLKEVDIENILASFETPFWIAMKNFYLIITKHEQIAKNTFVIDKMQVDDQDEFNQPVIQWWIVPLRARIDDIPTSQIMSLGISYLAKFLSQYYYFKNVKNLVIYCLDQDLVEWLVTYVNYLEIKHLDLSHLCIESRTITSLLSSLKNIVSLRIQYGILLAHNRTYFGKNSCLKYLDISATIHKFDTEEIVTIALLFPDIEHLSINTKDLSCISMLKKYLPNLHSLTFKITDTQYSRYDNHKRKLWDDQLRQKIQSSFQREKTWVTIWVDQAALEEVCWQTLISNLSTSNSELAVNTCFKRRFPYFQ